MVVCVSFFVCRFLRLTCCVFRLRSISPVIEIHGIEYEKGKFQDKLNNGTLSLAKTSVRVCAYVLLSEIRS